METQSTINAWVIETFGEAGSNAAVAARANREMAELFQALTLDDQHPEAGEEIADVLICLFRLAERMWFELELTPFRHCFTSNARVAARANRSMSVALDYLTSTDKHDGAPMHIQDAASMLVALAERLEVDVRDAVDAKMRINRARRWQVDACGIGHHIMD